jgi:cyanate permease
MGLPGLVFYGDEQVDSIAVKKYFKPVLFFNLVAWFALLYFMIPEYDDHVGLFSAFIINIGISSLYLLLMLRRPIRLFSLIVAFCKMTGTFLIGIFGMIHWPENHFLASMVILTFTIDLSFFIILIYRYSLLHNKITHADWSAENENLIPAVYLSQLRKKFSSD